MPSESLALTKALKSTHEPLRDGAERVIRSAKKCETWRGVCEHLKINVDTLARLRALYPEFFWGFKALEK